MGCGASTTRNVSSPKARSRSSRSLKKTAPLALEEEPTPQLSKVIKDLNLEACLPNLRSLGVRSLQDVAELLVSDLEEAGLTRVQVRQLQRVVQEFAEPSPGSPTVDHAPPPASAAFVPAVAPVTSPRSGRPGPSVSAEALDVLSADSNSVVVPEAIPAKQDGPTAGSWAGALQEGGTKEESGDSWDEPEAPEVVAAAPAWEDRGNKTWEESEIKPVSTREPSPYAELPHGDMASPLKFDSTVLPASEEAQRAREVSMEQTLVSMEQTLAPASPERCPLPRLPPARGPRGGGGGFTSGAEVASGGAAALVDACGPDASPGRSAGCSEPAPEEEPQCVWAAGLRGGDAEPPDVSRSREQDSWHDVMMRQQPNQGQEAVVGDMLPEAMRRRLERRGEQRSLSRGGRTQVPQQGPPTPPYQQQIDAPPCSNQGPPWTPAPRAAVQRAASVDAGPGKQPAGSRTPARARRSEGPDRTRSADSPPEKGGRQMFDKNALRKANRQLFIGGIRRYRQRALQIEAEGIAPAPDLSVCTLRPAPSAVRVYVRKRPLFEHEENDRGEYDVATVVPGRPLPTQLILHSCLFQADLKTAFIGHLHFEFDHVFREGAQDHEVYRVAASELVRNTREGGVGTMFMFGQTGSGKTHTMTAIEGMAAHDLFEGATGEPWVSLQFIELCGNHCFDLLAAVTKEKRPELRLREHSDGSYAPEGASQLQPRSPQELCAALRTAHARRATSATDANATSSRSHAVCTMRLLRSGGQLTLADCAGTERRKDSMYHSKERQQEGAEINASLHALKECVRYASSRQRVPPHVFRASALTKLLSGAFGHAEGSQLAVICTVSPCAMDTEHTLATLRTGMALGGRGAEREEREVLGPLEPQQQREAHPKNWSPAQVGAWLVQAGGGKFQDVRDALPSNFTGQMLVRLTEGRCTQLCGGDERRGHQLFGLLHREIRRADLSRRPHASP